MLQIVLLLLSLLTGSAQAQGCGPTNPNCIVPTAPLGTSNNQAASTEFVILNSGGGGGGIPALPPGNIFVGNGSSVATARTVTGNCVINAVGSITCIVPIDTGVSGLGTGVAAFLGAPSSANLLAALTTKTGTGLAVFQNAPTFLTSITSPVVIGGTGTTSLLQLRATTGVGASGADIVFQVGNGGATEAARILNNGNTGFGTASPIGKVDVRGGSFNVSTSDWLASTTGSALQAAPGASTGNTYIGLQAFTAGASATGNIVLNATGGNVGIAKTNPGSTLDITGTFAVSTSAAIGGGSAITSSGPGGALASGAFRTITPSGSTTTYATTSGSLTSTHCVNIDASGNLTDSGATCATGTGSVTTVSVVTANGVSGSVANPTTTPAITLTLTKSGNTTTYGTTSGTLTNGHCVSIDASGNLVDAGGSCTIGGGGGTVNAGAANQLAYYVGAGTAVSGLATANSGVLVTSAGGVPSISTTLPNINLGTPSAAVLTNATGLPIASGVSGLGTGIAAALAINTGSAGAPVLFNGAGGTPASLNLANAVATTRAIGTSTTQPATTAFVCNNESPVDIRCFGAVENNMAMAAVNQAAFAAAFAANASVLCPGGMTFYTQQIVWSATGRYMKLDCDLVAGGSYAGQEAVIYINAATQGILIEGAGSILADFSTYPSGVNGINIFGASANVTVRGLTITGFYDIRIPAAVNDIKILNNVLNYDGTGIQCEIGCSQTLVDGNRFYSRRGKDGGLGASFYSVAVAATNITITNNHCDANGSVGSAPNVGGWCYTVQNGKYFIISNNIVINNGPIEGITAYGEDGTVRGNLIKTSISHDLGISIGPLLRGCICDNVVDGAFASGIVLVNNQSQFVTVTGNTIIPAHPAQVPTVAISLVPMAGGSGYSSAPSVTISGGSGSGATATAYVSGGSVYALIVTSNGTGYMAGDTLTVSFGGPGTGAIATAAVVFQEGWACISQDSQNTNNAIYGNSCLDPLGDMYWNILYLGTYQPNYYGPNFGPIGISGYSGFQAVITAAFAVAAPAGDQKLTYFPCANLSDSGTACSINMGTTGHTIPYLDGTNTWSGVNRFATNSHYSIVGGTGSGFWLDSITTGADRLFFGSDAATPDTFRIFSALSGANLMTMTANATPSSTITQFIGSGIFTANFNAPGIPSVAQTNVLCFNSGTGAFTYQTWAAGCLASSERFKRDIVSVSPEDALSIVSKLDARTYRYRPEYDLGDDEHVGFTAEQVAKVAPEMVEFETVDGARVPHGVKYQELLPLYAAAVKQLMMRIEALEQRPN